MIDGFFDFYVREIREQIFIWIKQWNEDILNDSNFTIIHSTAFQSRFSKQLIESQTLLKQFQSYQQLVF